MITLEVVVATLRVRIREIDYEIRDLRAEQRGLEKALNISLGQSAVVGVEHKDKALPKSPDK
jgi:hypothetical protein